MSDAGSKCSKRHNPKTALAEKYKNPKNSGCRKKEWDRILQAGKPVDDTETKDVCCFGFPLDHYRVSLLHILTSFILGKVAKKKSGKRWSFANPPSDPPPPPCLVFFGQFSGEIFFHFFDGKSIYNA